MRRFLRWWSGARRTWAGIHRDSGAARRSPNLRRSLLLEALEDRFLPSANLLLNAPALNAPALNAPALTATASYSPAAALFVADKDYTTPEGRALNVPAGNGLLENVYAPNGSSIQVTAVNGSAADVGVPTTLSSGAVVTMNADGSFTYTPSTHYLGTDSVKVTFGDGSASTTAFAHIDMVALVGSWRDWAYSGQTLTVPSSQGLLDSGSGGSLQVTAINGYAAYVGAQITLPSGATLTVNADGSLSYTAAANFTGSDSFIFTAGDGVNSTNATATIIVSKPYVPPPPVDYVNLYGWRNLTAVTGQPLNVNAANGLLEYASDSFGRPIQITAINGNPVTFGTPLTLPSGATLTVNSDGSFVYVSAPGFSERDSFNFTGSDGIASASVPLWIDVLAPGIYVYNTGFSTLVGHSISGNLLTGAFDTSGNTVQITSVNGSPAAVGMPITLPSGAALTVNADGTFTYVPGRCFVGQDRFTFTAGDGVFSTTTIAEIETNPLVRDWGTYIYAGQGLNVDSWAGLLDSAMAWGVNVTAINGCATDVSTPITLPSGATLTVNGDGSFSYMPAPGYSGIDSFTFTVSDGQGQSTAAATINVFPTLYLYNSSFRTYTGIALTRLVGDGLLAGAYDTQNRTPQVIAVNGGAASVGNTILLPSGATLIVNANGSFVCTPARGFWGDDSFSFTASDGLTNVTVQAFLSVFEPSLNVGNAMYSISANHTLGIVSSGGLIGYTYDMVGDTVQVAAVNGSTGNVGVPFTLPSGATLTVYADGSFIYVPATDYTGDDSFAYTITDGLISVTATATINVVTPAIDLANLSFTTAVGQTLWVASWNGLLAGANDSPGMSPSVTAVNGNPITVGSAISLPSGAVLSVNADGSFTYTPAPEFVGNDSFTFMAADGPTMASATVTIAVTFITHTSFTTNEGLGLTADVWNGLLGGSNSSQITAINGSPTGVGTTIMLPSGATLTVNADGSFSYVPAFGFQGTDSFTATASDGAVSASATVTIDVTAWRLICWDPINLPFCAVDVTLADCKVSYIGIGTLPILQPVQIWCGPIGYEGNAALYASFAASPGQTLAIDAGAGLLANNDSGAQVVAVNGRVFNVGSTIILASGATLAVNPDGSFNYTPAAGYAGQDHFNFTVEENGLFSTATATIDVNGPASGRGTGTVVPHGSNPGHTTYVSSPLGTLQVDRSNGLLANFQNPSGATWTVTALNGDPSIIGAPLILAPDATLTVNADGSFTYVPPTSSPPPGFNRTLPYAPGSDSFTVSVSDGTQSVMLSVTISLSGFSVCRM